MKKPLPLPWGAKRGRGTPAPAKAPKTAITPAKGVKSPPAPPKRLLDSPEKRFLGVRVGGRVPPKAKWPREAVEAPDYDLLGCTRTATGQDVVWVPGEARAPYLRVKLGAVTGKRLVSYEGDDIWYPEEHGGAAEAARAWLVKFSKYMPEAARLLRLQLREQTDLLS